MSEEPAKPVGPEDARGLQGRLARDVSQLSASRLKAVPDRLADALRHDNVRDFSKNGPFAACLFPLLEALRWRGSPRDLAEALPHFVDDLDTTHLLNVLADLGYWCRTLRIKAGKFDDRLLPALLIGNDGEPLVLLRAEGGQIIAFDPRRQAEIRLARKSLSGQLKAPALAGSLDEGEKHLREKNWIAALSRRFQGSVGLLLVILTVLNFSALAVSLYVLVIYDRIIPARNEWALLLLFGGFIALLLIDFNLRRVRARIIAHVGARLESIIAGSTLRQIMGLETSKVEDAPIGAQVSRIREFDSIRDLFTGPVVSVVLELPFIPIFLVAIWALAGPVVWVPIAMLVVYALIAFAIDPILKRHVKVSSRARAERHEFLIDLFRNIRSIKQLSSEKLWLDRFAEISASSAFSHFHVVRITQLLQTLAQAIMVAAGVAAISWSVVRVDGGHMTMGAMIAVMSLIWRLLSPVQNLFLALTRLEQAVLSAKQINQLMRNPVEGQLRKTGRRIERKIDGAISFDRVSFRYRAADTPALLGVQFNIAPGELIAIQGGNGAGKSTLLRLVLAMNRPQAGAILLDGVDLRQMNPVELRQILAYVPQETSLFHGSIAQNLRLGEPLATDRDLHEICDKLGILRTIEALPHGFETRLGDQSEIRFNTGFRQALNIARAMVKKAPILLLDEPAQALDPANEVAFMNQLRELKGHATVLMVSHRPSHIVLADKVAVLNRGQLAAFVPPEQFLQGSNALSQQAPQAGKGANG